MMVGVAEQEAACHRHPPDFKIPITALGELPKHDGAAPHVVAANQLPTAHGSTARPQSATV
jgi:hypothetical protein